MNPFVKLFSRPGRPEQGGERPDFAGKILAVYCMSGHEGGMLRDVRLARVGFNEFVVGKRIEPEPSAQHRWSGVTVWISTNVISQMLVFDDIESARRAFQPHSGGESRRD